MVLNRVSAKNVMDFTADNRFRKECIRLLLFYNNFVFHDFWEVSNPEIILLKPFSTVRNYFLRLFNRFIQ